MTIGFTIQCPNYYCTVFINFYSTSHSLSLSETLLSTAIDTVSEFTRRSATGNCKWRTCSRSLHGGLSGIRTRDPLVERYRVYQCATMPHVTRTHTLRIVNFTCGEGIGYALVADCTRKRNVRCSGLERLPWFILTGRSLALVCSALILSSGFWWMTRARFCCSNSAEAFMF